MTKSEVIIAKVTSGKFWLSIIAGLVFAYASVRKILSPEAIATIITMVFISYFQRDRKNDNGTPKLDKGQGVS